MGYNASGWVKVTATPAQLAAAALRLDGELTEFYYGPTAEAFRQDFASNANEDFLPRLLLAGRFEDAFSSTTPDGTIECEARYHGKWWEGAEFPHRLLAQAGVTVEGTFRGEDDDAWVWASRDGKLIEENLVELRYSEVARLRDAEKLLTAVQEAVNCDWTPEEALTAARLLVASWQPPKGAEASTVAP